MLVPNLAIQDVRTALGALDAVDGKTKTHLRRALYRIGAMVRREAIYYAPISPTIGLLRRFRKAGGAAGTKVKVGQGHWKQTVELTPFYAARLDDMLSEDPRATTRPKPGGLMRSIEFASDDAHAEIFVAANSPAGKYARRIHDEKGLTWWNRGPGTQAKGPQADHRFIQRAIYDTTGGMMKIIDAEMRKIA